MTSILAKIPLLKRKKKKSDGQVVTKKERSLETVNNKEEKQLEPLSESLPKQSSDTKYWLRERKPIDYNKTRIIGQRPELRRYGCDLCFRKHLPDIHLGLADKTHCRLRLIIRGKSVPFRKKFSVNIYRVMVKEKNHRRYMQKVWKKVVIF